MNNAASLAPFLAAFCWILLLCQPSLVPAAQLEPTKVIPANLPPVARIPFPALAAKAQGLGIPLDGIDSFQEGRVLESGDSITALISFRQKGGKESQWLLYVEALSSPKTNAAKSSAPRPLVMYSSVGHKLEFASSPIKAMIKTIGPIDGKDRRPKPALKEAKMTLDQGYLGLGLDRSAAAILRLRETKVKGSIDFGSGPAPADRIKKDRAMAEAAQLTLEEERALGGSFPALNSYFTIIQETPGLQEILIKAVDLPSVWSIVRNLGIKNVNLVMQSDKIAPIGLTDWNLPLDASAYRFPVNIELNGQVALKVTFLVTRPQSPILACAGIVGLVAEKPDDKDTTLTVRIISAQRSKTP